MEEQGNEFKTKDDPVNLSSTEVEPITKNNIFFVLFSLYMRNCVSSSSSFFPRPIKLKFSVFLCKDLKNKQTNKKNPQIFFIFVLFIQNLSSLSMLYSMSFPHSHWAMCKDDKKSKSILHYVKTLM